MTQDRSADPAPRHLVALLAAFTSLVVLTTDVYLPVLPRLGRDLGTSNAGAAATLSAVLVGIAVGQIVIGPLSDSIGRRRPLLIGAASYAALHVLAALAPNLALLLAIRALTGLATAACIVVARAMVADAFPGNAAARAFATLSAVTAIAPVLAPTIGGALSHVMSWRGMFGLLAVAATAVTVLGWRAVPETLAADRRRTPHLLSVLKDLGTVLVQRRFLGYVAVVTTTGGGLLFGYIGASSFVLEDVFGLSAQQFSFVFAGNAIGLFGFSWLTRHFVVRFGPARMLLGGQLLAIAGSGVLALGVALSVLPLVLIGLFCAIGSIGLVMSSATSLGLAQVPQRAGSASGVLGICQFAAGALASPLAGLGGSAWSMVIVIAVSSVSGLLLRLLLTRPAASPRPQTNPPTDRADSPQELS